LVQSNASSHTLGRPTTLDGGCGEIRTHGGDKPSPVFKFTALSKPINHLGQDRLRICSKSRQALSWGNAPLEDALRKRFLRGSAPAKQASPPPLHGPWRGALHRPAGARSELPALRSAPPRCVASSAPSAVKGFASAACGRALDRCLHRPGRSS
jgi:hypothetical protein